MGSTAIPENARDASPSGFLAWLPRLSIRTTLGWRRGRYYAIATDFGIAGVGVTEEEASRDLSGLLESHLRGFYERGRPFEAAVAPIDPFTRLRLTLPLRQRKRVILRPIH